MSFRRVCNCMMVISLLGIVASLTAGRLFAGQTDVRASIDAYTRAQYRSLTEADWLRYEMLMRGPAGYTEARNLDPVTVLGVYAGSDEERARWAELAARQEHDRIAAELAFAGAYASAWKRLYPDETFGAGPLPAAGAPAASSQGADRPLSVRLMLFVDAAAPVKTDFLARTLAQVQSLAGTAPSVGLDLYVVGAKDDAAARAWADRQRVGKTTVAVTLQADTTGTLAQASALAGLQLPRLPAWFRRERGLTGERIFAVEAPR